ncbi:MAG: molybdenum ABC transporter ATP-binding protein [Dehalococcoidia bacterium]|nr:molybdenum ABC transporter ATP-binding protein [Dehalococcoidia bacterium]
MAGPFLEVTATKRYPTFELKVDASVPPGITAVFGPSGSGKTTILDCIAGLKHPEEGEISLNGRVLASSSRKVRLKPEERRIGYMFQEGLLFPHYSVIDNISYGYKRTPRERRWIQPDHLVELLDLGSLLERRPGNLSSGERQRVALARALATSPELLLLDEPLSALDMGLRGRILRYLKAVHRDLAIPMLYVSHAISEVMAIADMVLVLSHGKQLAFDQPRKVLLEPYVHSLVGSGSLENMLDGQVEEHLPPGSLTAVRSGDALLWLSGIPGERPPETPISVAIPARDIIVALDVPSRMSARNILHGRVESIHPIDNNVLVYADVGTSIMAEITPEALENLGLREGQDVYLVIKSSSIIALD